MNKQQLYGFLVLAMFLGTMCHAMEHETSEDELVDIKDIPERLVIERRLPEHKIELAYSIRHHPYKAQLVMGGVYGGIGLYDLISNDLELHSTEKTRNYLVNKFGAYNPEGTSCVVSRGNEIFIHDLDTKKVVQVAKIRDGIEEVIFSHDGSKVVVALRYYSRSPYNSPESLSLKVLDLATKKLSDTAIKHPGAKCITRSPDGKTFASTDDRVVALWNLKYQKIDWLCKDSGCAYGCLAFSPDGTQLAAGRNDGHISIWNLQNKSCKLIQYPEDKPYKFPQEAIAYCPRINKLIVVSKKISSVLSSQMDLLDLETCKFTPIDKKNGRVYESAFSEDGSTLAQIVQNEEGFICVRYTYLLPKKCYSIEELAVMQRLYTQQLIAQKSSN